MTNVIAVVNQKGCLGKTTTFSGDGKCTLEAMCAIMSVEKIGKP